MEGFDQILEEFCEVLREAFHPFLNTKAKKQKVHEATGISIGTLNDVAYTGRVGLKPILKLSYHCYNLSPKQFLTLLVEIKEGLRSRRVLSKAEMLWSRTGDKLTEDEQIFFSELALAHKNLKPSFLIKKGRRSQ